jgi:uncharacterized damage-inducible protein DinB
MKPHDDWRTIIAGSLSWEQAHATFDAAVDKLPPDLHGRRPERFPHSAWELVEHIRRTQHDLLDFCENPAYVEPHWPDDYWPRESAPPTAGSWSESLAGVRKDREAFARFTTETDKDLTARIPHGTGQTYLRTILVAIDHTSYHVGQLIAVRRLLGAWPIA